MYIMNNNICSLLCTLSIENMFMIMYNNTCKDGADPR